MINNYYEIRKMVEEIKVMQSTADNTTSITVDDRRRVGSENIDSLEAFVDGYGVVRLETPEEYAARIQRETLDRMIGFFDNVKREELFHEMYHSLKLR